MGTELIRHCIKEENMEIPSIPPGFESLAPFTLKKVEDNQMTAGFSVYSSASKSQLETDRESSEDTKAIKSLRRRHGVNYSRFDHSSGDDSDAEQNFPARPVLPKGVIRGCADCRNCQKVTAKWHPEEACRPDLQEAPVFYPTEEEFEDTLGYIAKIRSQAEAYGICRIVPPPSWKPPCPLKEKGVWENSKFATRIQRIDKLQNRDSMTKLLKFNQHKKKKRRKCMRTGADHANSLVENRVAGEAAVMEAGWFGFEHGPEYTLDAFQRYANDFKSQYFRKSNNLPDDKSKLGLESWEPTLENIEGEYWRMVEKPTEEIEVLYGADLETGLFGSGFPKFPHQVPSGSDMKYLDSGWNLNKFPRLPGSVLSYESSDISGVLVPWLYIGMCFSSFCWHVEDHHLYSLNYMHWGAPKMWYGVPGSDALKLEVAMRKHLPDLFEEQPDLLHKLVTQLSPSILKSEGVSVYRCVQSAGEFVLTFPRAYHAGFNCGFNCAEAVNVAPVDWLPHGQNAIELYREQGRKTSISHDKLLLGAARDAVRAHWELNLLRKNTPHNLRWKEVCGKEGILSKALKARVEMERVRREFLCSSSQALKMESTFDATSERECSVCFFDLHLSATGCHNCSPDKYACLTHAKQLCSCSWGAKFFLFRYDINELNILLDALEGKLSAVYRWAKLDLGLALSSYLSKENAQHPARNSKATHCAEVSTVKEVIKLPATSPIKEQKEKYNKEVQNLTPFRRTERSYAAVLALESVKNLPRQHKPSHEVEASQPLLEIKREEPPEVDADHKTPVKLISLGQACTQNACSVKSEVKKPFSMSSDVILLSDDEGEDSKVASCLETKDAARNHEVDEETNSRLLVSSHVLSKGITEKERVNHSSGSETVKPEDHAETIITQVLHEISCPNADDNLKSQGPSECKESIQSPMLNTDCNPQSIGQSDNERPTNEDSQKKSEFDANSRSTENLHSMPCNTSSSQNNLDRYFRQKGPRIAKVVRRINCNVEALEIGVVQPGKSWCESRAIYPKGFKSRVRYIDVLDPTNMCFYISEILDPHKDGPLFMVSLEHSPVEVFVHLSATKCWEMVRERVNQEITRQHKLGKLKLPPLQPPGSLDGMEMFGFSSPAIVQAIQAMDQNRVCIEYWKSRPLMQIPQYSLTDVNNPDQCAKSKITKDHDTSRSHPAGVDILLNNLFKKANTEELHALYSVLSSNDSRNGQCLVTRILDEEIHKRK